MFGSPCSFVHVRAVTNMLAASAECVGLLAPELHCSGSVWTIYWLKEIQCQYLEIFSPGQLGVPRESVPVSCLEGERIDRTVGELSGESRRPVSGPWPWVYLGPLLLVQSTCLRCSSCPSQRPFHKADPVLAGGGVIPGGMAKRGQCEPWGSIRKLVTGSHFIAGRRSPVSREPGVTYSKLLKFYSVNWVGSHLPPCAPCPHFLESAKSVFANLLSSICLSLSSSYPCEFYLWEKKNPWFQF